MSQAKGFKKMDRRAFLKIGIAGTASALLAKDALADSMQQLASAPFTFPSPVYRTLGRTGLKVTVVSFGAMLTPEAEVIRLAIDNGVNYIDTARRYMGGKNEEIVGQAIKGRRDKVYIATKTQPASTSKADIIKDVETSLTKLGTDHIDVIQLHNLESKDRIFIAETKEALLKLKEQGKVRFFGVTTHKNVAEVVNAVVDDKDRFFDTALVAYNFKSGKDVTDAIERAAKAGVGVIAMKTQQGGYSTSAMGSVSPHQAALKWALQNPHIANAIPGMKDMAHLREDIAVMGMKFTARDERILERYNAAIAPFYCSFCGKCESTCPHGVEISTINRSLMYAEGYRSGELARTTYREVPRTASASICTNCPTCTAQCVNGLDIAAKMERARIILA